MAQESDFKLCYVEGDWAYFTTQALDKQWGDDWNDAPYEHNAERPYEWQEYMTRHGIEPYEIKKLPFDGDFAQPCSYTFNSAYSVEMINGGAIPWLWSPSYGVPAVTIPAGTNLPDFIRLVKEAGGRVYLPIEQKGE